MTVTRKAYRAAILHSIADPAEVGIEASYEYFEDGLLVVDEPMQVHGASYSCKRIVRVTERTADRHGQMRLTPDITLEGWWTDLNLEPEQVIALYRDHATSEQFHSEFKTDLDLERLPSGKFASLLATMAR